jgi:hypothetical protein
MHGCSINLIIRNCNHFADDFCRRLMGRGIPRWINRLPYIFTLVQYFAFFFFFL